MSDTDTQRPDELVEDVRGWLQMLDDKDMADIAYERLEDTAVDFIVDLVDAYDEQRARAERAEADNARLREALMEIKQRHQEWAGREHEQGLPSWGSECEAFADNVRHILNSTLTAAADESQNEAP